VTSSPGNGAADALARNVRDWVHNEFDERMGEALGEGYQATVRLVRTPHGQFVIKCPHAERLLGRFARASIVREHAVYERLAGIDGIPRCYGLVDGQYLILEHIEGKSYRDLQYEIADRDRYFESLLQTLRGMHAAGVAHGDLKRKDNLLVGPGERPYIIDFGIACMRKDKPGFANRIWFDWIKQIDYNAWLKLKYRRALENMSSADRKLYRPLVIERVARWLRGRAG